MPQIFYESKTREDLIKAGAIIAHVKYLQTERHVIAKAKMKDFPYTTTKYLVIESLKGDLKTGETIEVELAEEQWRHAVHEALAQGDTKIPSPIFPIFTPVKNVGKECIIYLRPGAFAKYELYCRNACEPLSELSSIKKSLAHHELAG